MKLKNISAVLCIFMSLLSSRGFAEKLVYAPNAEQGEWEVESTGVYDFDPAKNKNAVQEYHYAVGHGVNSFWHTEVELEAETEPMDDAISRFRATHLEWENVFQLAPKGEYWLDPGIYLAYEAPLVKKEVGQFEGKILLEKDFQKISNILNISLNQEVGEGADPHTGAGVSWSTRYRLVPGFQPGFEYWNNFSEFNRGLTYNEQSHQVGPVFYGRLLRHWNYDLGYLFGISEAAPKGEIKWGIEYEF